MKICRIALILALLLMTIMFVFCQKKLFGCVEVHGQILNYITKEPITVNLTLNANDAHSASSFGPESIILATTKSKSDGTFSLKSRPSKISRYYLHIDDNHFDAKSGNSLIDLKNHEKKDMGILYAGSYEFICKIILVSTSNKCIWLYDRPNNKYTFYNNGTNATVIYKQKLNAWVYEELNHNFLVECKIDYYEPPNSYIFCNNTFLVSISSTDTLKQIINY